MVQIAARKDEHRPGTVLQKTTCISEVHVGVLTVLKERERKTEKHWRSINEHHLSLLDEKRSWENGYLTLLVATKKVKHANGDPQVDNKTRQCQKSE